MAKFKDPDTGEIIQVSQYTHSINMDIYKDRHGKELVNKDGKPLEIVKEEKKFDINNFPTVLTFGSKSVEEKKKILLSRSKSRDHEYNRIVKDKKAEIDNEDRRKTKPKKSISMSPTTKKKKNG